MHYLSSPVHSNHLQQHHFSPDHTCRHRCVFSHLGGHRMRNFASPLPLAFCGHFFLYFSSTFACFLYIHFCLPLQPLPASTVSSNGLLRHVQKSDIRDIMSNELDKTPASDVKARVPRVQPSPKPTRACASPLGHTSATPHPARRRLKQGEGCDRLLITGVIKQSPVHARCTCGQRLHAAGAQSECGCSGARSHRGS